MNRLENTVSRPTMKQPVRTTTAGLRVLSFLAFPGVSWLYLFESCARDVQDASRTHHSSTTDNRGRCDLRNRPSQTMMGLAVSWLLFFVAFCSSAAATALARRFPHPVPPLSSSASALPITALQCAGGAAAATATTKPKVALIVNPLTAFVNTIKASRRHLLSAAFGRGLAIFIMYPVDSIKTRVQMGQANALRLVSEREREEQVPRQQSEENSSQHVAALLHVMFLPLY
jgi:hypothetical protein